MAKRKFYPLNAIAGKKRDLPVAARKISIGYGGKILIITSDRNYSRGSKAHVLTKNPLVILDGLLGAVPYFIFVPWFWQISPAGTIIGLLLGELHVVWRHVSILKWKTPVPIERLCNFLGITTPERHWLHHQDGHVAYGDIFNFYDRPARAWLGTLLLLKRKLRRKTAAANG